MLELVVFIGLPASGKTSFYRERFASTHAHVSKDLMARKTGKQRRMERRLREHLQAGESVVVDNTNPGRADREPLIALAREADARVVGYYFRSRLAECEVRNAERADAARVPDVGLRDVAARLQAPAYDEGFDELFYVSIGDGFQVEPWNEDI